MSTEFEALEKRLEKTETRLDSLVDQMTRILVQNATFETVVKKLSDTVDKLESSIDKLNQKPGRYWDKVVTAIITGIVGAAITYLALKVR